MNPKWHPFDPQSDPRGVKLDLKINEKTLCKNQVKKEGSFSKELLDKIVEGSCYWYKLAGVVSHELFETISASCVPGVTGKNKGEFRPKSYLKNTQEFRPQSYC